MERLRKELMGTVDGCAKKQTGGAAQDTRRDTEEASAEEKHEDFTEEKSKEFAEENGEEAAEETTEKRAAGSGGSVV